MTTKKSKKIKNVNADNPNTSLETIVNNEFVGGNSSIVTLKKPMYNFLFISYTKILSTLFFHLKIPSIQKSHKIVTITI